MTNSFHRDDHSQLNTALPYSFANSGPISACISSQASCGRGATKLVGLAARPENCNCLFFGKKISSVLLFDRRLVVADKLEVVVFVALTPRRGPRCSFLPAVGMLCNEKSLFMLSGGGATGRSTSGGILSFSRRRAAGSCDGEIWGGWIVKT